MHYADIYCSLTKAGYTVSSVAADLGVTPQAVSQVIRGHGTSYNVASYVAAITGKPLNKLWPDRRYAEPPKANAA